MTLPAAPTPPAWKLRQQAMILQIAEEEHNRRYVPTMGTDPELGRPGWTLVHRNSRFVFKKAIVTIRGSELWFPDEITALVFADALVRYHTAEWFPYCLVHPDCWRGGLAIMERCQQGRRDPWGSD